jgi:hypothetical protein
MLFKPRSGNQRLAYTHFKHFKTHHTSRLQLMALTKFGFIVTGDRFEQLQGTPRFSMKVVGVVHASEGGGSG